MINTIDVYRGDPIHPKPLSGLRSTTFRQDKEENVDKILRTRIFVGESERPSQSTEANTEKRLQWSPKLISLLWHKDVKRSIAECVNNLLETAGTPDWDGEGADPVMEDLAKIACDVVRHLPDEITMPEVSASPYGDICLDWDSGSGLAVLFMLSLPKDIIVVGSGGENGFRFRSSQIWNGSLHPNIHCLLSNM